MKKFNSFSNISGLFTLKIIITHHKITCTCFCDKSSPYSVLLLYYFYTVGLTFIAETSVCAKNVFNH